jgi:hypothetical protein
VHARGLRRTRCGGPTRSLTARGGTRARGGADRGRLDPVLAELAPTWRLRGCHAGRREVDDDAGRNGRRSTAASGGANHGDTSKSEHTGWLHVTRGDEPTARIRRRELDGGESRRRREKGKTATRSRGANSRRREHLRGYGNPMLASDWAELRRARPATSGASELGRRRRRAHGERRQRSGRRRLATGRLLVLPPKTKGGRWSEEEERREALPCGSGRSDERPTARE